MSRNPVVIVDEFLRSGDSRLRKNAVVALGAIPDRSSTERLVDMALDDADPQVREAAERELVRLLKEGDSELVGIYRSAQSDPKKRDQLYALFGRLKTRGARIREFRTGFQPAFSLFSIAHRERPWTSYFRTLPAALLGVLATSIFLTLVLGAVARATGFEGVSGSLNVALAGGAFLGVVIALLASFRTTAYTLHPLAWRGLVVEVVYAVVLPLALYSVAFLMISQLAGASDPLWATCAAGLAAVGGARVFTIIAAGTSRSRRGNFIAAAAVGTFGSMLVCTAVSTIFAAEDKELLSQVWVMLLPICGGVSTAFAWIDSRVENAEPPRKRVLLTRLIQVLIPVVLGLLLVTYYRTSAVAAGRAFEKLPAQTLRIQGKSDRRLIVRVVPFHARLELVNKTRLNITWPETERVWLTDKDGKRLADTRDMVVATRAPGTYHLYYGAERDRGDDRELSEKAVLPKTIEAFVRPFDSRTWMSSGPPLQTKLKSDTFIDINWEPAAAEDEETVVTTDTSMTTMTDTMSTMDYTDTSATDTTSTDTAFIEGFTTTDTSATDTTMTDTSATAPPTTTRRRN